MASNFKPWTQRPTKRYRLVDCRLASIHTQNDSIKKRGQIANSCCSKSFIDPTYHLSI